MIRLDRHAGACLLVVEIDKILFGTLKIIVTSGFITFSAFLLEKVQGWICRKDAF